MIKPRIELLASHHDRAAFSCGEPSLDTYLHKQAGQDVKRDLAACYVLCGPGNSDIIGYYTLSVLSVAFEDLPPELAKRQAVTLLCQQFSSAGWPLMPASRARV